MPQGFRLGIQCRHQFGVGVPQVADRDAGNEIGVGASLVVIHGTAPALDQGKRVAGVGVEYYLVGALFYIK